ncbi:hypothetical protein [Calothrix sp. PCC 7507]|uniref:hypothetical protein n=1 Tax=Calothrix sp. PCC 7507 TaxID=99598 RepID=UPI00029F1349|nr:hypothetical protein [Calothrix sp. PCC 7507]AFY36229.1 hypothetical protein Cal7507_5916 [Calothrix sp. PCC 7507]
MARRKRNSATLERAERRIESLQSIDKKLDFGQGVTIEAYDVLINDLRSKLAAYNTALSSIDKLTGDVKNAEQLVLEMSEKMLLGVGSRYGKTSQEYEMAGGSRRKNSRRSTSNSQSTNSLLTNSAPLASANGSTNGLSPVK